LSPVGGDGLVKDPVAEPVRLVLIGHGRMGRLVESLAPARGFEVVAALDSSNNARGAALEPGRLPAADVAIDFSIAEAVVENLPRLARIGLNAVVGTTGWQTEAPRLQGLAVEAGIGVVVAANFSIGVAIFEAIVRQAAALFAGTTDYGAWIHEQHHAAKRDAPSGTALLLEAAIGGAGYGRPVNVASTRAGSIPGTHTIGFDGPFDTVTLSHVVRDRSVFALGALGAARWVHGRRGWYTMRDVLGLEG
jgi:4-hydroxy-tetrahydrodipicolinate reductase